MIARLFVLLAGSLACASALFTANDDVVELTASNFASQVTGSGDVWIVEFYAPWCGHCKNLVPEYKKAATALKGIAKVGAVDMTAHQSVGGPYNVRGFPTIKIFGANKNSPTDFNGARTAAALTDAAIAEVKKVVSARLSGKAGGGGGGSGGSGGGGRKEMPKGDAKDVVELTDSNMKDLIENSNEMWLVEFYAPWCGHCKNLAPHWQSAATELKGKVKLGALDATVHTIMAGKFGIQGFPTIKAFAPGKKSVTDAFDYDGGRTANDIVSWALAKLAENVPPPEIHELTSQDAMEKACGEAPLCVVSVLPHLLDCQSECRNKYIDILKDAGERLKKQMWGYVWTEAMAQPALEEALGIGGFGYPAMAVVNARKGKFSILKGPFTKDGINEFLRDLSFGRGSTAPLGKPDLPKMQTVPKWDGKDAEPPQMEDIDLDDVELDKIEL